jgi:23S rRNA pseudouridine2604 synthase
MATLKLKKIPPRPAAAPRAERAPVRGAGSAPRKRPTLSQAQALRAEREARYQEQLRQRFGDKPPAQFAHRDEAQRPQRPRRDEQRAPQAPRRDDPRPAQRQARPPPARNAPPPGRNNAFESRRDMPRAPARPGPQRRDDADDDHQPHHPEIPGSMRLSKRMSELGIASRREADEWIAKGWVRVDDHVVSELGSRVLPGQRITVDAKAKYQQAQKVTVLVNKPIGYVSGQAEDGYEPAIVLVTPQNQWRDDRSGIRFLREHLRGLAPAGRLDIDSVGLLVLTQDGRIAKQLIGEDSDTEKEYLVRVQTADGAPLPQARLALLRHGLELDGEPLRAAEVEWINDDQLRFVLKEGKKRQIRRMCEAVGLKVLGLKRVRIGSVMLGDLPPGQWRYLRADEYFAAIGGKAAPA